MNSSMCFGSGALDAEYAVIGSRPSATATSSRPSANAVVGAAVLVELPVHRRRPRAEHLQAVHADVALPVARVVRDHGGQRDERAAVARPRGLHGQEAEVDLVAAAGRSPGRRRGAPFAGANRRST